MGIVSGLITNGVSSGMNVLIDTLLQRLADENVKSEARDKLAKAFQEIQDEPYYDMIDKYFTNTNKVKSLISHFTLLDANCKPLKQMQQEITEQINPPYGLKTQVKSFILKILQIVNSCLNKPTNYTEKVVVCPRLLCQNES